VIIVMVEGGSSGGGTCGPVAKNIYKAIQDQENRPKTKPQNMARIP